MSGRNPSRIVPRDGFARGRFTAGSRDVPEEVPVAFSFRASTYAVMMASPSDLDDFAYGFCLSEGIISAADEITSIEVGAVDGGIDVRVRLADAAQERLKITQRRMAGPVGCGLCGVDSIGEALRDVPTVIGAVELSPLDVASAVDALSAGQVLNAQVHAVHGAGFYVPGVGMALVREDVGRHNALDKLIGAMARGGVQGGDGALVMTSRISVELVQKAARADVGILIAVSVPTALAIDVAEQAGITLIGIARGDDFEVFTHPNRVCVGETIHVG